MDFQSLDKALTHSSNHHPEKPILLLGNGFSRECCIANNIKDVFSYTKLVNLVKDKEIEGTDKTVGDLFKILHTVNFECVLDALNQTKTHQGIIEIFSPEMQISKKMDKQITNIKNMLSDSILSIHPIHQYESISTESYKECAKFLKKFSHIYTLNYDLLLYWAHMNDNELKNYMKDGFWNKIKNKYYWDFTIEDDLWPGSASISYLHGGLHLFLDSGISRLPYKVISQDGKFILQSIKKEIKRGRMPLCVTEGSSGFKLDCIFQNEYLSYGYRSLLARQGALVVYGVSFEKDQHIINAIKANKKIKSVYVGIHNNHDAPYQKIKEILEPKKKVFSYSSDKTYPWGENQQELCDDK